MKNLFVPSAFLALTALLSACDTHPSTPAPGTLDPATLSGKLSGWTFGGKTQVALYEDAADKNIQLEGAQITEDGTVNLTLLAKPQSTADLLGSCTFEGTRPEATPQIEGVLVTVFTPQDEYLGQLVQTRDSDGALLQRLYSDRAATFKGTLNCGDDHTRLDLNLRAGWNVVALPGAGAAPTLSTVDPATPVTLKFVKGDPATSLSFEDVSALTLRPGQAVTRRVTLTQKGGLSGDVTLSVAQPGITVTPGTLSLPAISAQGCRARTSGLAALLRPGGLKAQAQVSAQALSTTLTFGLNDDARSFDGNLLVEVSQGGKVVGSGTLYANVRAPSLTLTVDGSSASPVVGVYRGETSSILVGVTSEEGFSGPAVIALSDLPAGITASPVTVNVVAGATSTVKVPVQVSSDRALGLSSLKVTATRAAPLNFSLKVKPARTLLGQQSVTLLPATHGIWVATSANDDTTIVLRRFVGGQKLSEVSVDKLYAPGTLAIPGGELYVISSSFGTPSTLYRLNDTGKTTSYTLASGLASNLKSGVVDAQGRIWYTGYNSAKSQAGVLASSLYVWNPETGNTALVDDTRNYSSGMSYPPRASASGRYLVFSGGTNGAGLLIDTQTRVVSEITGTGGSSVGQPVVSDSGQVWYTTYNDLNRVEADGSVTTFKTPSGISYNSVIGLDHTQAVLWLLGNAGAYAVDTKSAMVTPYLVDAFYGAVLNTDGGLTYQFSDGGTFYLSQLP